MVLPKDLARPRPEFVCTKAKRKTGKPTGGQPKIVRLSPIVFCCSLGPRFRAKGARVQCVGRKNHAGNCRSSEFSSWDRRNPLVWLSEEPRGAKLKPTVIPEDKAADVVAVTLIDVHGHPRHIVVCNECTRTIVAVWARLGRGRTKRLRQKLQPTPDLEAISECTACGNLFPCGEDHTCQTEDDGPQSE